MTDFDFRAPRLCVPDDLSEGAELVLAAEQAHYVANVVRIAVGGDVLLFNGRDGEWQAPRIARIRGLAEADVAKLIDAHTEGRQFGLLGEPRVNVLTLNLALDRLGRP